MSNVTPFNSSFMIGFEQLDQLLAQITKSSESFPPYNIERLSLTGLRVSIAVAGYTVKDLSVELDGNQLCVRGKQKEDKPREFLYKGIASRSFYKSFLLAEGLEVKEVFFENGLLQIDLVQRKEEKKKTFSIQERKGQQIIAVQKK